MGVGLRQPWAAGVGATLLAAALLGACGTNGRPDPLAEVPRALVLEARPIGRGARFHPPATGRVIGPCAPKLGARNGVHVELFAEDRVVLVAQGIGTDPPRTYSAGRITGASCFGDLVTIDPTGLVLVRPGHHLTLSELFRSWGQSLSERALAGFRAPAGTDVSVFIDGQRSREPPSRIVLQRHSEIVLEVGPHVPPHASYAFPSGT